MSTRTTQESLDKLLVWQDYTFAGLLQWHIQQWQAIEHKNINKLGQALLAQQVAVAYFLYNCQGILDGNNGGLGCGSEGAAELGQLLG
jgi:hypothetical protein